MNSGVLTFLSSHTSHHPSQTPCLPCMSYALKNWCSVHGRCSKNSLKHCIHFCSIFSKFKTEIYCISFSKVSSRPDCIFEIQQQWQSGFSRVYSNCCCSCLFEPEIIKIGQSSHKLYSHKILNSQESTTILNACTKNVIYISSRVCLFFIEKNPNKHKKAKQFQKGFLKIKLLESKICFLDCSIDWF